MAWTTQNFPVGGSTGGDPGSGGMTIHGASLHDATVPTKVELQAYLKTAELGQADIIPPEGLFSNLSPQDLKLVLDTMYRKLDVKPNLLYNSTGMRDLDGWLNTNVGVSVFKDAFVNDDDVHFVVAGPMTAGKFMTSRSIRVTPETDYTVSFQYRTENGGKLVTSLGVQTGDSQLNTDQVTTIQSIAHVDNAPAWLEVSLTYKTPANAKALVFRMLQTGVATNAISRIGFIKIEQNAQATRWVPNYTDWMVNSTVTIGGLNAASFL